MRSRMRWALCLALVPLIVSGCILFEPARWGDLTGPSWDVPLSLPLFAQTRFDLSGLETIANHDNEIGFHYPIEPFTPPELIFDEAGRIFLPHTVVEAEAVEVSLTGLADLPDIQVIAAELSLAVENMPGLEGELSVRIAALRNGDEVAVSTVNRSLAEDEPLRINLASLLNGTPRPDRVRLQYALELPAQSVDVQPGDRLAVEAELWVPLYVHLPSEPIRLEPGTAFQIELDEEAKATLADARLTDLALVIDAVNRSPLGVDIELQFSPEPTPVEDALSVVLEVPNGEVDSTGRAVAPAVVAAKMEVTEELRQLLVDGMAYVIPTFSFYNFQAGADGVAIRFAADDYISLQGYAIVTVGINRR